jgi:hypothetical protein
MLVMVGWLGLRHGMYNPESQIISMKDASIWITKRPKNMSDPLWFLEEWYRSEGPEPKELCLINGLCLFQWQ